MSLHYAMDEFMQAVATHSANRDKSDCRLQVLESWEELDKALGGTIVDRWAQSPGMPGARKIYTLIIAGKNAAAQASQYDIFGLAVDAILESIQ